AIIPSKPDYARASLRMLTLRLSQPEKLSVRQWDLKERQHVFHTYMAQQAQRPVSVQARA
ncbi:hypothetical protein, partial [Acetobacter sp.]|uniref:hypothetical protein n=1 Tax=Acetobacter sp. TaxID=440 RepID=UPI0039ED053D